MAKLIISDPFFLAKALKWYKQPKVQQAILENCENREVSPRYGQGFGKRPDALYYPADILAFATRKATSFHCSEERWRDPQQIQTGAPRKEMDALRTGWDLVLDIDCPYWLFAKLTTLLFIEALKRHGITNISTKFSGNKGFHIGVAFEAFPKEYSGRPTAELFPEAPRAIAQYLLEYIADPKNQLIEVQDNNIIFNRSYKVSYEKLKELTGKDASELIAKIGKDGKQNDKADYLFLCTACGNSKEQKEYADYLKCDDCQGIMQLQKEKKQQEETQPRFNVEALIEVDTVLLASRHLYRAPYSLHEKSGLVSIVFDPKDIMAFERDAAKPQNVKAFPKFLKDSTIAQAEPLLVKSMELAQEKESAPREFTVPEDAIPEELFPPCMRNILNGLTDGRKRAMFALTNFLRSCGWSEDQIEARVFEWNKKNPEQLREVDIKGHLRYHKHRKEVLPPPNCKSFYNDLQVCTPDNFCKFIKNPAQYAKKKVELAAQGKSSPKGRAKLTEEQKEMRRKFREMKAKKTESDSSTI